MSELTEQAKLYKAKGYYARERKRRGLLGWFLRPRVEHEIYDGRDWLSIDILQSVFGYFFGGGWVFGLVENDACRIESRSIAAYEAIPSPRLGLPLKFRVGDVRGQRTGLLEWSGGVKPNIDTSAKGSFIELTVHRDRLSSVSAVPPADALRKIDQFALIHDKEMRQADEIGWRGRSSRSASRQVPTKREANEKLLTSLRGVDWEQERIALDAARSELGDDLWREMRRLIKYECFLAQFSAEALDVLFDPIDLTLSADEARHWLSLEQPKAYATGKMRTSCTDEEVEAMSPRMAAAAKAMRFSEMHFEDFD